MYIRGRFSQLEYPTYLCILCCFNTMFLLCNKMDSLVKLLLSFYLSILDRKRLSKNTLFLCYYSFSYWKWNIFKNIILLLYSINHMKCKKYGFKFVRWIGELAKNNVTNIIAIKRSFGIRFISSWFHYYMRYLMSITHRVESWYSTICVFDCSACFSCNKVWIFKSSSIYSFVFKTYFTLCLTNTHT